MKLSEVVEKLGDAASNNSLADLNPEITGVAPVDAAAPNTLSFIEGGKFASQVAQTAATALILPPRLTGSAADRGIAWIATPSPRLLFARAIALFYEPFRPQGKIHPTAVIDPSAIVGENVYIGAHAVIEAEVKIGKDVCIYPNVVIYPEAEIGDRTILHAHCTIHERSRLGADCVIHTGAVIGAEGFGFVPTPDGWLKMVQSGCTILEDGVEVGCNSAIDRPAVGETRVGRNTKIDNLVQIGHGCKIGENCAIAGQAGMAGGVKLGNQVTLAGQAGIVNGASIGDGAIASAKAAVYSDVPPGEIVSGYPAIPHKRHLKASVIHKRLPEIYQMLKQLQRRLNNK